MSDSNDRGKPASSDAPVAWLETGEGDHAIVEAELWADSEPEAAGDPAAGKENAPLGGSGDPHGQELQEPPFGDADSLTVGQKAELGAHAEGLRKNNDPGWCKKATEAFFGPAPSYDPFAWRAMPLSQQREHQAKRQLYKAKTNATRRAADNYRDGKFAGVAATRTRAGGAGPDQRAQALSEAICEWFARVYENNGGRVTAGMIVAKIMTAADAVKSREDAAAEVEVFYKADGARNVEAMRRWTHRWMKRYSLSPRRKATSYKLTEGEQFERLGAYWRNCARCLVYFGEGVVFDGLGQTPFYRNMNAGEKCAQLKNDNSVKIKESAADAKNRFAVTLLSSTAPPRRDPEALFRGTGAQQPRDITLSAPKNVTYRFSQSATHGRETLIQFPRAKFGQKTIFESHSDAPYKVLVLDQFAGHLQEDVLNEALKRKRAPLICWGGLTGMVQTADMCQISKFKAYYRTEEANAMARYIRGGGESVIPRLSREDTLWCVSRAWKKLCNETDFLPQTKLCFKRSGTNCKLGGSEDMLLDDQLAAFWRDQRICGGASMPEWRERFLSAAISGEADKPRTVLELISTFENPHVSTDDAEIRAEQYEAESETAHLPKDLLLKYAVERKNPKATTGDPEEEKPTSAKQKAAAAKEVLRLYSEPGADAAGARARDAELLSAARALVSSPRAKQALSAHLGKRKRETRPQKDAAKRVALEAFAAEENAEGGLVAQEEEDARAEQARIRELANPPKKKARAAKTKMPEEEKKEKARKEANERYWKKKAKKAEAEGLEPYDDMAAEATQHGPCIPPFAGEPVEALGRSGSSNFDEGVLPIAYEALLDSDVDMSD